MNRYIVKFVDNGRKYQITVYAHSAEAAKAAVTEMGCRPYHISEQIV
jgi:hypothetical protein